MTFTDKFQAQLQSEVSFEIPAAGPGQRRGVRDVSKYQIQQQVFVLYSPHSACYKCKILFERQLDLNEVQEDDVSASCPHNNKKGYLEVLQHCHEDGWYLMHWREETLKNGTVQASVTWGVPKEKKNKPGLRTAPTL